MEAVVQATINALGYLENGVYYPEPDCFESIRDLIRFLRNDSGTAEVRRLCGERNIVPCDLIPIMKAPDTPDSLFDIALRLTINLCQPAALAFGGKNPEDNQTLQAYCEIEKNLVNCKEAFADIMLFKVFEKKATAYFAQDWLERQEELKLVAERIIALVRYVLSIGATDFDKERSPHDVNSHDQLVLALVGSGFGKLLIEVCTNPSDRDFHLWILEIFAMMLKQHEAKDIVEAGQMRLAEEKSRQEREMQYIVEQETKKQLDKRRRISSRHTNFAGSYILKGLKAINKDNDMVVSKVIKNGGEIDHLNKRKIQKRISKNRRPFDTGSVKHFSALNVRLALRSFCVDLLQKCYCRLMAGCKDAAFSRGRTPGQSKADIHYFFLMQLSMEFCRLAELSPEYVKATLGVEAFHHVQTQLDSYLESARIERKEGRIYGLRAQYALAAYKELLYTLIFIMKSGRKEWKWEVESVCSHILQVEEYRDLSSCVIRRYMPGVFSKTFLRNVVLANHAYISLVERFSKNGLLSTIIKRRKVRKRKSKAGRVHDTQEWIGPDWNLWDKICEELSDVIFGYIEPTTDICAIDVLLHVDDEVHQQFAMLLVQQALRQQRIADAVGLYRTARTLWPLEGVFGTNDIVPEDEFLELHAIYFADLKEIEKNWRRCREEAYGSDLEGNALYDTELAELEEEKGKTEGSYDSDAGSCTVEREIDFVFDDYVAKFARTDVLKWYVFLLADFEVNTAEVNKAVLKLLHRVAFDLKMAPRLYQLSLFNIFKQLAARYENQSMNEIKQSEYFEIYQFGYHLLRKFYADYKRIGSRLIPEILFWKGPKESYEITHGYGSFEIKPDGRKGKELLWPEELDNELRALYEEFLLFEEEPEGVDIVEYIEQGLSRVRTRRQIIRQMKMLGLNTFGLRAGTSNAQGGPKSTMLKPDIVERIRNLVEMFNSAAVPSIPEDMVNFIRSNLPEKCSRARIIKQLHYEGIHYEPPLKKRRSKTVQNLKEESEAGDEKLEGSFISRLDRQSMVYHEKKGKKQSKRAKKKRREKSVERFSPEVVDNTERVGSTISSVSVESYSHENVYGRLGTAVTPRSTVVDDSLSDSSHYEEIVLRKKERSLNASSLLGNDQAGQNNIRNKRIIESDSE